VSSYYRFVRLVLNCRLGFYSEGQNDCASGITFGLNPNSSQTEAEFQQAAMTETDITQTKSSAGTSKSVKIGVSVGVVLFALLAAASLTAFLIYHRRKTQAASHENGQGLDNWNYDQKTSNSPELRPRVPSKNYELSATRSQQINLPVMRYELPSSPVELSSSRSSSGRMFNTASPPHQGSFYREADEPSL
jgi:hypothetical protein